MIVGRRLDSLEEGGGTNLFEDRGDIFVVRWCGIFAFVFLLDERDVMEDLCVGEDCGLGFDDLGHQN